jgi:hypothetical protein
MSLQLSQNVRPVQVQRQGQTRTKSPSNFPDPNAVLNSLWYTFDSENEIKPRTRSRSNTYWPKLKRMNDRSQISFPELFVFETLLLKFVISQTAESSSNKCVPLFPLKITALSYWLINKQILPPRNLPKIIFTFLCWVISKDCWQVFLGSKDLQISEKVV